MKRALTAVAVLIMFAVVFVAAGLWYSPLTGMGEVYEYRDNAPYKRVYGLYLPSQTIRADFEGDENAMYAALFSIDAEIVKTVESGGTIIVYAISPRVASARNTSDFGEYNIMSAYSNGHICIGAPVLGGSY